jgi:hypothetical protein
MRYSSFAIASWNDPHTSYVRGTFTVVRRRQAVNSMEEVMGLGRGALLWLLGVPLPIIILLALFWHH